MIDQSRDASAVSLSESKSSQDSGRIMLLSILEGATAYLGAMMLNANEFIIINVEFVSIQPQSKRKQSDFVLLC